MKVTMDYMIGNTAVQIINTGKRIRIIDVEKKKLRKRLAKWLTGVLLTGAVALAGCFCVVNLQNDKILLDEEVYALRGEIDDLERENIILEKQAEQEAVDYKKIYKKAKKLGMTFPKSSQMYSYKAKRSSVVRMNSEINND